MIDRTSTTWRLIAEWAAQEIEAARVEIEKPVKPPPSDDFHRGRIAALRDLLRRAEPAPTPAKPAPVNYGVQTGSYGV